MDEKGLVSILGRR